MEREQNQASYTFQPLYTISQAADVLNVSESCIKNYMKNGSLPFLRLQKLQIKGEDLATFISALPYEEAYEPRETRNPYGRTGKPVC